MIKRISVFAGLVAGAVISGTASNASVIFSDSFENPVPAGKWYVYQNVEDWKNEANTAGIEIQKSGTVSQGGEKVNAYDGNQYVELDSHNGNGGLLGVPTNSAMTKRVALSEGTYELSWYYLPRTGTAGDNLIEVFLAGKSDTSLFDTRISHADGTAPADWEKITTRFTISAPLEDDYAITFRAGGTQNTLGGFVDKVTLAAVPLPAGVLLLGLGLAGMCGARVMQKRRAA